MGCLLDTLAGTCAFLLVLAWVAFFLNIIGLALAVILTLILPLVVFIAIGPCSQIG